MNTITTYPTDLQDENVWFQSDALRFEVKLASPIDPVALKKALLLTQQCYLFLQIKPILQEDRVVYLHNDKDVVIRQLPGDAALSYGAQTNDYPWSISYDGCCLTAVFHHGLFDGRIGVEVLRTLLYEYCLEMGITIADKGTIYTPADTVSADRQAELPYETYHKLEYTPVAPVDSPTRAPNRIQSQYLREDPRLIRLTFDTESFIRRMRELNTSPSALMSCLTIEGMKPLFDSDTPNMLAYINVDLRPVFGSDTMHNFADSMMLFYDTLALENLPLGEKCDIVRGKIKGMVDKNRSIGFLKHTVSEWQKSLQLSFAERRAINLQRSQPQSVEAYACLALLFSYVGRFLLPPEIEEQVADIQFTTNPRKSPLMIECLDFKGKMQFFAYSCLNTTAPLEYFRDELIKMGIPCEMEAEKVIPINQYNHTELSRP